MRSPVASLRPGVLAMLFLLLTLAVSACGGGDEEALPEPAGPDPAAGDIALPAPGEQARLRCSQTCASHGHCGNSANAELYVLLDRDGPVATAGRHDMAVPDGTIVSVRELRPEILVSPSGEEQLHNFFRVLVSDRNEEAWVAAWCIAGAQ